MSEYGDITTGTGATAQTGDYSTNIKIIEAGLALAYRIDNNWSVGGTYRLTYAVADINMASAEGPYGVNVRYEDMVGWNTFGMRIRAMSRANNNRWGWGMNYRSEVEIEAKGEASFDKFGSNDFSGESVTATTTLPFQISTSIDYRITDDATLFGEITYSNYSNYSTNKSIKFTSDDIDLPVKEVVQEWNDQYNYRMAVEYTEIEDWALRGGYIYTTAVVPEEYASPTFSTPSFSHTVTFGAGRTFMDGKIDMDLAADDNIVRNNDGKGGGTVSNTGATASSGHYESKAYAVHMSLRYNY